MRRRRGTLSLAAARMPAPGDQAVLDDQTLAELTRRFYEKADLDPILGPVILAALPPEQQAEVLDFIEFLGARRRPVTTKARRRELRDDPFIGMWADRQDMADSSAWVRRMREREWGG